METIQLQKIIDLQKLDSVKLAAELFPGHKHPSMALSRVITGQGLLNSEQVLKLSEITNLPIGFIYASGEWKASASGKTISFVAGEVEACLTPAFGALGYRTAVNYFHKDKEFTLTLLHPSDTSAKAYLSELAEAVIKNSINNKQ